MRLTYMAVIVAGRSTRSLAIMTHSAGTLANAAIEFLFLWVAAGAVTGLALTVLLVLMFLHLRVHQPDTYEELGTFLSLPVGYTRGQRGTNYLLMRFIFNREYAKFGDASLERLGNLVRLGFLCLVAEFVGGWLVFVGLAIRGNK